MKKLFSVIFILVVVGVMFSGCAPTPEPTPTITPTPTELPFPEGEDWYGWWNKDFDEWPREIDGQRVCYIQVSEDKALWEDGDGDRGEPILPVISQVPEFGGNIIQQRTIAKEGKWLMVYARGSIFTRYDFIEDDTAACRPFRGDGGRHVYLVMEEQIVDNHGIWEHPDRPLYFRVLFTAKEFIVP